MIRATQFSTMGAPVGDPWIRAYPQHCNRDLNQGVLVLWTKFGDPSLNRWRVIVRTSKWLIHTHTQTQATTIPGGQNWPRVKTQLYCGENRWRFFCLLRIIQESGVYQLGVPQGQGDSSAPSTTDPLICGFCLVTTPNTRGKTVEQSNVTWTDKVKPAYPAFHFSEMGAIINILPCYGYPSEGYG